MAIRPLAELDKEAVIEAIIEKGSMALATVALGIGYKTLRRKLKTYGLQMKINQLRAELKRTYGAQEEATRVTSPTT